MLEPVTRLTLDGEQLDLLDDVIAYYSMSDMGGGARDNAHDRAVLRSIDRRVDKARQRLGRETDD